MWISYLLISLYEHRQIFPLQYLAFRGNLLKKNLVLGFSTQNGLKKEGGNNQMALYQPLKKENIDISMFIDLDKETDVFYNNMYIENLDIVVKMPLMPLPNEKYPQDMVKIEPFDLTKYIYLVPY
jgi:hypothetical protein